MIMQDDVWIHNKLFIFADVYCMLLLFYCLFVINTSATLFQCWKLVAPKHHKFSYEMPQEVLKIFSLQTKSLIYKVLKITLHILKVLRQRRTFVFEYHVVSVPCDTACSFQPKRLLNISIVKSKMKLCVFKLHHAMKIFGVMSIIVQKDATIYGFIIFLQTSLHVSGNTFTNHQEHT